MVLLGATPNASPNARSRCRARHAGQHLGEEPAKALASDGLGAVRPYVEYAAATRGHSARLRSTGCQRTAPPTRELLLLSDES